jgi:integrase
LRSQLQVAVIDGERFDTQTGLPASWSPVDGVSWWAWSREWLALKWPQWSGHSRRSAVESLVAMAPHMIMPRAGRPPDDLGAWLRDVGYRPGASDHRWLGRWSVPLADIDAALLERVLTAATTKRDGTNMAAAVVRRRRTTLGAVLRSAVRRGLIDANPLDQVEWRAPERDMAVDVATVPSLADVVEIVDHLAGLSAGGARYAALYASVGMAGLRPSEAIGLKGSDLDLPTDGWGLARLRGAMTSPGRRYSAGGEVHEVKGLKQRPRDATRDVPLPPQLVDRLRFHIARWPSDDSFVFTNGAGRPATAANYGPVWTRARREVWPADHPLASTTVYDLRHAAATMMLRAGVPPAEVARRLGHSVDILMRVYAGVLTDERERSNAMIEAEIERQLG